MQALAASCKPVFAMTGKEALYHVTEPYSIVYQLVDGNPPLRYFAPQPFHLQVKMICLPSPKSICVYTDAPKV